MLEGSVRGWYLWWGTLKASYFPVTYFALVEMPAHILIQSYIVCGHPWIQARAPTHTDIFLIVFKTSEYVLEAWKTDGQSCPMFKAMRKQHKFKGSATIRWCWQFLPLCLTSRQFPLQPLDKVNMVDRGQFDPFNSRVGLSVTNERVFRWGFGIPKQIEWQNKTSVAEVWTIGSLGNALCVNLWA